MTLEEILAKMGSGPDASEFQIKNHLMYLLLVADQLVQVQQFMQHVKEFVQVLLQNALVVKF